MIADILKKNKMAIFGGAISTVFIGIGVFLLGNISGHEAKHLLSASLSGLNMLCNTITLAAVTILALLLTLLSVSAGSNSDLKKKFYSQILNIARVDVVLLVGVLILFQFFNIPLVESENVPLSWYEIIYWTTLFLSSVICGMTVTLVLMLFTTVSSMISIIGMDKDHDLVTDKERDET